MECAQYVIIWAEIVNITKNQAASLYWWQCQLYTVLLSLQRQDLLCPGAMPRGTTPFRIAARLVDSA